MQNNNVIWEKNTFLQFVTITFIYTFLNYLRKTYAIDYCKNKKNIDIFIIFIRIYIIRKFQMGTGLQIIIKY